jgi:HK97 gp10 family phage protein
MMRSNAKALEQRIMAKLEKFLPKSEQAQRALFRIGTILSEDMRFRLLRQVYSKPTTSGRVRTGRLMKSVKYEINEDRMSVGSFDVHYAKYIEYGTRKMLARPFVEPAYKAKLAQVRKILAEYGAL